MARKPKQPALADDAPLTDPSLDRLGRDKFAQSIASAITRMQSINGFVMSIQGAWGAGKTTTINFVEYYLRKAPAAQRPIIIRFNPWWFNHADDLLLHFFKEFRISLKAYSQGERFKKLGKGLEALGNAVSMASYIPIPIFRDIAGSSAAVLKAGGRMTAATGETMDKDFQSHRKEIDEILRSLKRPILVIIDDLDRLTADEIYQVFRLVKSVANFPNTVYLLSFEKRIIARSLDSVQNDTGDRFLEKIIQASFELPPPNKQALQKIFFERLDRLVIGTLPKLFDTTYWGNVYFSGVASFITTLRDVNRLSNAMELTYPTVKGAVNFADYTAMEALRVFQSSVYEFVRVNCDLLSGDMEDAGRKGKRGIDLKTDLTTVLNGVLSSAHINAKVQGNILDLLKRLFPKVAYAYGGYGFSSSSLAGWREEGKICSPDVFDTFFSFSIADGSISAAQMTTLIDYAVSNPELFKRQLLQLASEPGAVQAVTKAKEFLERFRDFAADEQISEDRAQAMLVQLFDVIDLLPEDKAGMLDIENSMRALQVTHQLLKKIPDQERRFAIISKIIKEGTSFYTLARKIIILGQEQGKHKVQQPTTTEQEWEVSKQQLEQLEAEWIKRIQKAADDGELALNPHLSWILWYWSGFDQSGAAKKYAVNLVQDPKGVANLLEGFLQQTESVTMGDLVSRKRWVVPYAPFESLIGDPSKLKPIIDELLKTTPSWLSARQKQALESFLLTLKNPKQGTVGFQNDE